jgi:altronate dehydratase
VDAAEDGAVDEAPRTENQEPGDGLNKRTGERMNRGTNEQENKEQRANQQENKAAKRSVNFCSGLIRERHKQLNQRRCVQRPVSDIALGPML